MLFGWAIPVVAYSATGLCEVSCKANSHSGMSSSFSNLRPLHFLFLISIIFLSRQVAYKKKAINVMSSSISLSPLRFFTSIEKINVVLTHYRASKQT